MDLEAVYVVQPPRYQKPEFNTDPDPHGFIGHEQTIGQEPAAFMRFSSLAHVAIGSDQRAGVARIAYYVKENNTHTYDLYRSDTLPPFPQDPKSCTDPVLCKNIKGFEVLYTDHNGDDHKYWDSDSEEFNHTVPAGIHLTLRCGSDEKSRAFDFSVDLAAGREPVE
jgi:general secretion pathway protein J